ncbi:MAG: CDP-alcohol phosphatidyltransferase family protein [Brucellaceae bacterium]|nr:CDP-alcohol phosphatidyltransferase family protein [Brucellaceae bacterium]
MTIPNFITVLRFILVPAIIMAMLYGRMDLAFAGFLVAGVSDGIDGFIARQFDQRSELGAWLDPVADKLLLVSVVIMLGKLGHLPAWLVVLIVSRDVLIVGAVILQILFGNPMEVRPLMVSKANTVAQIAMVTVALAGLGFGFDIAMILNVLIGVAALLTVASGAAYLVTWLRFVGTNDGSGDGTHQQG